MQIQTCFSNNASVILILYQLNLKFNFISAETANSSATIRASRDDTMQDSRFFPGHSFDGMDTLEELADKEQFFNNLAADVSGTLDFGKLNRALDEIQSDNEKRCYYLLA